MDFGVDSSSRCHFRPRTDRQTDTQSLTDATDRPIPTPWLRPIGC